MKILKHKKVKHKYIEKCSECKSKILIEASELNFNSNYHVSYECPMCHNINYLSEKNEINFTIYKAVRRSEDKCE